MFLTSADHDLHLYQVWYKYLERFKSYGADTISLLISTKWHDSINIAPGVTVLILCTSSDHGLYLYQVPNISNGLRALEWTRFVRDRQTNTQTDRQTFMGKSI